MHILTKLPRDEEYSLPAIVRAQPPVLDDDDFDTEIYTNGIGDSRGYFSEGTYIAAPTIGPTLPNDEHYLSDTDDFSRVLSMSPQEAHTTRILTLFHRQRNMLRSAPPAKFDPLHNMSYDERIKRQDPSPAALVAMSTVATFAMLKHVTKRLKKSQNIDPRMSAWIMSILAQMDEKLMDGDSIYLVRELSKKAMWLRFSFDERFADLIANSEYDQESQYGESEDHEHDEDSSRGRQETKEGKPRRRNTSSLSSYRASEPIHDSKPKLEETSLPTATEARLSQLPAPEPVSEPKIDTASLPTAAGTRLEAAALDAARLRLLEKIEKEVQDDIPIEGQKHGKSDLPDFNTKATIDMIITIVAEVYGQKDMLDGRIDWLYLDEEDDVVHHEEP